MRQRLLFVVLGVTVLAVLAVATPTFSQLIRWPGGPWANAPQANRREVIKAEILGKWSNHIQEVYKTSVDDWAYQMATLFDNASDDGLQRAADATNFEVMNNELLRGDRGLAPALTPNGGPMVSENTREPRTLGDADTDLIYVPITPCRIVDTRLAGGAIAANTTRNFDVTAVASYSFQGGDASNCGGAGAAGSFAAVVINFTVVTPSSAGYITVFPYLATQPLAATVNYVGGDVRGNLAVVRLDQGASADEMSVYTFAQTHLVADMVGYYRNPAALTLQCVNTANTSTAVPAGGTDNVVAPACTAGYTQTATNCEASTWQMPFVFINAGTCSAQNNSASSATLRASRTCCRPVFN